MKLRHLLMASCGFGAALGLWLGVAALYLMSPQPQSTPALAQGGAAKFQVVGGADVVAVDVRGARSWLDAHYSLVGPLTGNPLLEQLLIVPPGERK